MYDRVDEIKEISLTTEEKDSIKNQTSVIDRINLMFGYFVAKANDFINSTKVLLNDLMYSSEANRTLATDISTEPNKIILSDSSWKWITPFRNNETSFIFVATKTNLGPTTFKINGSDEEIPLLTFEKKITHHGTIVKDGTYLIKILAPDEEITYQHAVIYPLSSSDEELSQDDLDNLVLENLNENIDDKIVLGMKPEQVNALIQDAIDVLKLELKDK